MIFKKKGQYTVLKSERLTLKDRKTVLAVTAKVKTEATVHIARSEISICL